MWRHRLAPHPTHRTCLRLGMAAGAAVDSCPSFLPLTRPLPVLYIFHMIRISVTDARDKISDLVARVVYAGEEVILTKHGRDVARIVPMESKADRPKRSTPRAPRR